MSGYASERGGVGRSDISNVYILIFSTKHRRLLSHWTIKYTQLGDLTLKGGADGKNYLQFNVGSGGL